MKNRILITGFLTAFFLAAGFSTVWAEQWAVSFSFQCITKDDCKSDANSLNLEVTSTGTQINDVRFTFINSWDKDSSITADYSANSDIPDYSDLYIASATEGVNFSPEATSPAPADAPKNNFTQVDAIAGNALSIGVKVQGFGSRGSSDFFELSL